MTTYRSKYKLDQTLYNNALVIIKFGPAVLTFCMVWIFGNEVYISTNNIIEDVLLTPSGSSYINEFDQTIYTGVTSNVQLPLEGNSRFTYTEQTIHRMTQSTYSYCMFVAFFGYIFFLGL